MSCVEHSVILILILILLFSLGRQIEGFAIWSGPSWNTGASGEPVPYGSYPKKYSDRWNLRRWRTPIPVGPGARQVSDNVWARTYDSGTGFQLG